MLLRNGKYYKSQVPTRRLIVQEIKRLTLAALYKREPTKDIDAVWIGNRTVYDWSLIYPLPNIYYRLAAESVVMHRDVRQFYIREVKAAKWK